MFELEMLHKMVCGAYKKLKSYYYYDKTLLYIKKNIACFEANKSFGEALRTIALNLYLENDTYFDLLIDAIDFKVMSKKLKERKPGDITQKDIDHNKSIYTLNFYIDAPVELLIVDCLWMLYIGKIVSDIYGESKYSYAGKFRRNVFKSKDSSLQTGIDYSSNRCFEPYFTAYENWRSNAVKTVGENKNQSDLVLMSLDFKSFYYNVNFNFARIGRLLKEDERVGEITFLTSVIERIYRRYTEIVKKYKDIQQESEETCILPIGLMSPIVLRNLYVMRFDRMVIERISPMYYGRYVDDLLLVINSEGTVNNTVERCIRHYLISSGLFRKTGRDRITFSKDTNLAIQTDKVKCYYFKKKSKDTLINTFYEQIGSTVSEANLFPDIEELSKLLSKTSYQFELFRNQYEFMDAKLMDSSYYNIVKFINGLKLTLRNVYSGQEEAGKYLEEILDLYKGSSAIEFFSSWRNVFELFVLAKDASKISQFYETVQFYIEGLEFRELKQDEIFKKKYRYILYKLKKSLMEHLNIACALAAGLDYGSWKDKDRPRILDMARLFRKVNLINHDLVFIPLINYTSSSIMKQDSLVAYSEFRDESINQRKMDYSPRFITLDECYLWYFMCYYNNDNRRDIDYEEVYHQFLEDNSIDETEYTNPVMNLKRIKNDFNGTDNPREIVIKMVEMKDQKEDKIRIGIVNTSISEEEALKVLSDPVLLCTYQRKVKLFKLLNIAAEERVDYLVFPEFFMPILWIREVTMYAKQMGVTIITGVQYMTHKNTAFNYTCIIARSKEEEGKKDSILFFREKNFYAPDEKFELAKRGYVSHDSKVPFYYVIREDKVVYSTVLCFEFTDILSRAVLKSLINVLFIPQLNKDTHYFSSVVEATSRDLHAFVIQSNTAKYGDSRITLPAKTAYREIAQVKGGLNDVILVNEINLVEFIRFQQSYGNTLDSIIKGCLACDHKSECDQCEITSTSYKHYKYKGLPPNF